MDFLDAVKSQTFMQNALITGILASLACGIVGTYVVVRKIGYIAGGISHAILGGMGIAYFLGKSPIYGAIVSALIAAIVIGLVSLRAKENEDTIISAIWAVGMALGVIFIARTPGYNTDLMSYLFGNILMVSHFELRMIALLDIIIIVLVFIFFRQFMAVCFDEEYSKIQGIDVEAIYLLLLCVIAVTVVILIQVVGLILVIALLTLPAAVAGQYSRSLVGMMVLAALLGIVFTTGGLALSWAPNLPAGATIIMISGIVYLLSSILHGTLKKIASKRNM